MDPGELVRANIQRSVTYCKVCGGNKRIRINITGTDELDFEKCKGCNGRGVPQKLKNTSDYTKLRQHWRKEFEH